ncbi:aldo/keto reductase [Streptomyces sp. KL2]|uniref:aldo/keto reductase n=1 Tax=Streptomyces sp. KL2 TaxID=3050126 RepID=UPI00397DAF01
MVFGKPGDPGLKDCARTIHRALGAGVNFIDTADVYGYGETEGIIGPRTLAHLEDLPAGAGVVPEEAPLDRIDTPVPPGTDIAAWTSPIDRRRRGAPHRAAVPPVERAAAPTG